MRLEGGMPGFSLGAKQMVLYRTVTHLVTVSTFPGKVLAFYKAFLD